jgi:hypothetical protein
MGGNVAEGIVPDDWCMVEFDYRSDGGPQLVGPFPTKDVADLWLQSLPPMDYEANMAPFEHPTWPESMVMGIAPSHSEVMNAINKVAYHYGGVTYRIIGTHDIIERIEVRDYAFEGATGARRFVEWAKRLPFDPKAVPVAE